MGLSTPPALAKIGAPPWRARQAAVGMTSQAGRSVPPDLTLEANSFRKERKKIFREAVRFLLQVYNQNRYTRIVVVLTSGIFCG